MLPAPRDRHAASEPSMGTKSISIFFSEPSKQKSSSSLIFCAMSATVEEGISRMWVSYVGLSGSVADARVVGRDAATLLLIPVAYRRDSWGDGPSWRPPLLMLSPKPSLRLWSYGAPADSRRWRPGRWSVNSRWRFTHSAHTQACGRAGGMRGSEIRPTR